jgi:hypothetical protein
VDTILDEIRESANKKILYLPHAIHQMLSPDRMIKYEEVEKVIYNGEIIEDYPDDLRGHSCLMYCEIETDRFIHVVCAPKKEYLAILTAYIPSSKEWNDDYKRRKK